MHFWINKGSTSFQYGGRRRPTFYTSSGTFSSAGYGRERNNLVLPPRYPSISSHRETYAYTTATSNGTNDLRSPRPASQAPNQHNNTHSHSHSQQRRRRDRSRSNSTPILPLPYATIAAGTSNGPDSTPVRRNHHNHNHSHHHHRNFSTSSELTLDSLDVDSHDNSHTVDDSSADLEFDHCCCCSLSTKRVGLTLCFLGFILLCTVAGKFIVEGPSIIDSSRSRGHINSTNILITQAQNKPTTTSSVSYFLITEIIFIAFALGFFLLGIACLRKRTNDYLLRQYRQQIQTSSARNSAGGAGAGGAAAGGITEDDYTLEGVEAEEDPGSASVATAAVDVATQASRNSNSGSYADGPGRSRRYYNLQHARAIKQEPPPYDVAIYLPLPELERRRSQESESTSATARATKYPERFKPYYKSQANSLLSLDKLSLSNVSSSRSNIETPPPSYQEQFSYEI